MQKSLRTASSPQIFYMGINTKNNYTFVSYQKTQLKETLSPNGVKTSFLAEDHVFACVLNLLFSPHSFAASKFLAGLGLTQPNNSLLVIYVSPELMNKSQVFMWSQQLITINIPLFQSLLVIEDQLFQFVLIILESYFRCEGSLCEDVQYCLRETLTVTSDLFFTHNHLSVCLRHKTKCCSRWVKQ